MKGVNKHVKQVKCIEIHVYVPACGYFVIQISLQINTNTPLILHVHVDRPQ